MSLLNDGDGSNKAEQAGRETGKPELGTTEEKEQGERNTAEEE